MTPHRNEVVRPSSPSPWRTLRRWLPAVVAAGVGGSALAQLPTAPGDKPMPPMNGTKPDDKKPAPAKPDKMYEVKFDNTEWSKVFDWLERETGLMYITKDKPTGSVTLKPTRKYTEGELLDLLNEALAYHKFVIVRKEVSFSTIPSDANIAKEYRDIIPLLTVEELVKRGKTEVVSVIIPLVTLQADEVRDQVRKSLSPFGEVSSFGTDQLLVLDKVANIRVVLKVIDESITRKNDQLYHVCKFRRASYVAENLRGLLKDNNTDVTGGAAMQQSFGGGGWDRGGGWGGGGMPQPNAARTDTRRFRTINISVDDAQNAINMTGPADKIIAAKDIIKDQEKNDEAKEMKPRANGGAPMWNNYPVATGTADAMGKLLMTDPRFKGSNIQVLAVGTNELRVWGYAADHIEIKDFLKAPDNANSSITTKVYPLPPTMDAAQITVLASAVKTAIANGLIADPRADGEPGIVLRGSPEIIKSAEDYIRSSVPPAGGSVVGDPRIRELTIPNANAGALAEHLVEMMKKMGVTAEVNNPNAPPKKPEPPKTLPNDREMQPQSSATPALSPNRVLYASNRQIADPQKKPDVVFNVIGNKLVITGEDPKKVQLAYELMSVYATAGANKAQERYEVIRLKNVAAEDAAKVITEVFNGPTTQQQNQQGGRGGQGGGGGFNPLQLLAGLTGGASAPTDPTKGRVRVVAEKGSNSIIVVKASELDMVTIRNLLAKAINNDDPPEGGVSRTYIIPLQYAKASEMVVTIRNVYANLTNRGARGGGGGGAAFIGIPGLGGGGQQQAQPAALTVDYDVDTNQVVVNCTEAVYLDVKKLCDDLDKTTKNSGEVTAVLTAKDLEGVSPTQVQSLLDGLAGRQPTTQQGGFGQGGFGQGGGGFGQGGRGGQGGFGGGTGFGGGFGQGGGGFGGAGGGRGGQGGFGGGGFGGAGGGRGGAGGGFGGAGGGRGGAAGGGFGGGGGGGARGGAAGGGAGGGRGGRQQRSAEISSYYDGGGGAPPF